MPMHHLPLKPGIASTDSIQAMIDEKRQSMGLYQIQTATNATFNIQNETGVLGHNLNQYAPAKVTGQDINTKNTKLSTP